MYEGSVDDVTESTPLHLEHDKVSLLALAEQQVINAGIDYIVLRAAGLVGPNRHPSNFFKQGRLLKSPNAAINLVHQMDVVQQIIQCIENGISGVFNSVSRTNVTKHVFYALAAKAENLAPPDFDVATESDVGRKVLGHKLVKALNYNYHYDDLTKWL